MVRPSDKDKDYYFPTEEELPFAGAKAVYTPQELEQINVFRFKYGHLANIINNVPRSRMPKPFATFKHGLEYTLRLDQLKSVLAGGPQEEAAAKERERNGKSSSA